MECLSLCVCVCILQGCALIVICVFMIIMMMMMILVNVVPRARIANRVVTDSRCRGGIANIRGGCSCALFVQLESPTALWRFRVSTSNSPNDLLWPPINTPMRYIYQIYARQGIQVYEDDRDELPMRQCHDPTAL